MLLDSLKKQPHDRREPDADSEALRVSRAKAGDAAAWDEWFAACYKPLFRYSYIRLRRTSEAEDIVSQVFIEAYRGIDRYTYKGRPILAWLYRIAHNLIYDKQKADARRPESEVVDVLPVGDGPESQIVSMDLLRAIDTLSDEQRDVIILRYFMAMPSLEVAAVLGKSQTAVFSLQSRALTKLRQEMEGGLEL